jgi:hypothetical protein
LGGFAFGKLKQYLWRDAVSLAKLSDSERQIIFQCLKAILKGRFLEGEFHTRLGIEPEELEGIVTAYPDVDNSDDNSDAAIAINNCLNEVCHGISFSDREWSQWFTVSKPEIEEVYRKWAVLRGRSHSGIR